MVWLRVALSYRLLLVFRLHVRNARDEKPPRNAWWLAHARSDRVHRDAGGLALRLPSTTRKRGGFGARIFQYVDLLYVARCALCQLVFLPQNRSKEYAMIATVDVAFMSRPSRPTRLCSSCRPRERRRAAVAARICFALEIGVRGRGPVPTTPSGHATTAQRVRA